MTRRQLLGGGAAAAALLLGCGDNTGRFGRFEMSIASWTFRNFSIEVALDRIRALGVSRVELSMQANHFGATATDAEIAAMRDKLAAHHLECLTAGLEWPTADHEANRRLFEYARKLGLRTLMVDPPIESLDSLEQLVAEYDIRIGIHNHGPGSRYSSVADVLAALANRDARIGAIFDTGHITRAGEDPVTGIHQLAGRLYGLHLKDVASAAPDAPDTILGRGVVDVGGVFVALRDVGFPSDASLTLEYEANPEDPFDDVAQALDLIEAITRNLQ